MNEFHIIQKYLSPLSKNVPGAFNLADDIFVDYEKKIAISVDTFVENVHFKTSSNPSFFINKIIRSSLSDLYCKGVMPTNYFLSVAAPKNIINKKWLKKININLLKEQKKFNVFLSGGDTSVSSKLNITIIVMGNFIEKPVLRKSAKNYDDIYVTGNIGDSFIGLKILQKKINTNNKNKYFIKKYRFPDLQVKFSKYLTKFASSSIDVSDGICQDLKHICKQSKKGAILNLNTIPFSKNLELLIKKKKILLTKVFSQGDDYQILFTSSKKFRKKISHIAKKTRTKLTRIGTINNSRKLTLLYNENYLNFNTVKMGYKHQFN